MTIQKSLLIMLLIVVLVMDYLDWDSGIHPLTLNKSINTTNLIIHY